jgi:hypothetical protein
VAAKLSPDVEFSAPGFEGRVDEAVIGIMAPFLSAFPDIHHEVANTIELGEMIATLTVAVSVGQPVVAKAIVGLTCGPHMNAIVPRSALRALRGRTVIAGDSVVDGAATEREHAARSRLMQSRLCGDRSAPAPEV